jgi:hypothetical protein
MAIRLRENHDSPYSLHVFNDVVSFAPASPRLVKMGPTCYHQIALIGIMKQTNVSVSKILALYSSAINLIDLLPFFYVISSGLFFSPRKPTNAETDLICTLSKSACAHRQ